MEDVKSSSALRTPARESKNGRLRAAFVAPHLSESLAGSAASDLCKVLFLWNVAVPSLSTRDNQDATSQ